MSTKTGSYEVYWAYRRFWDDTAGTVVTHNEGSGQFHIGTNSFSKGGGLRDWQRIIATGGNATTPLSGWDHKVDQYSEAHLKYGIRNTLNPSDFYQIEYTGPGVLPDFSLNPPLAGDDIYNQADNQARTKFYSHLAATKSQFKGMVFAGELKETLGMIVHPFRTLYHGLNAYLSAVIKMARKHPRKYWLDKVRELWLEYSFGWAPLISDIDSAIDEFYHSKWVRPIFTMVRGSGLCSNVSLPLKASADFGYGFHSYWDQVHQLTARVKYYGVVTSLGNGCDDSHTYGFSIQEFVPTLWELIPYSFLVDYFTNIGNIVSSWSYRWIACDWVARGQWASDLSYTENQKFLYDGSWPAYFSPFQQGDPGIVAVSRSWKARFVIDEVPIPSFEVSVPGLTSLKWLNIAALTRNLEGARQSLRF